EKAILPELHVKVGQVACAESQRDRRDRSFHAVLLLAAIGDIDRRQVKGSGTGLSCLLKLIHHTHIDMRFVNQVVFGIMTALPCRHPPHGEIISALTELYTLLDTLGAIEPDLVRLPPHSPDALNRTAALAAGYTPEAVDLMSQIPYLLDRDVELMPSTVPINHISPDADRGHFDDAREMFEEEVMRPTAVRLTRSMVYGTELIYDVSTGLLHPWATFEGPVDAKNYDHVPGVRPRAFLDPLIKMYRELTYLGNSIPRRMSFEAPPNTDGKPPVDWPEADKQKWHRMWEEWQAVRKLEDLYLECGWDVKTSEQRSFRRDEFLEKRWRYWQSVLEPHTGSG
ncbi:hypothetical protein Tdes44962_MAKER00598, partial [Teratosphaeria destructans]